MHGKMIGVVALATSLSACVNQGEAHSETAAIAAVDRIVRDELQRLEGLGATRAAIVVLSPSDGRILAAAGVGPEGDGESERDAPVGSTIKPFTIAAALDAGLEATRRFPGGERWRDAEGRELVDAHPRESFDAREVLMYSSNVGAGQIVEAVGGETVEEMLESIGVHTEGSNNEGSNNEGSNNEGWPARGAGVHANTTPLRLASAYAAFANGGWIVEPSLDGSGARRRVMDEASSGAVRDMLEAAVSDEGTGHRARVEGLRVGGKTGTTHTGAAVFAGIAPLDAPRWVVVVRAEAPGAYGGSVAAPAFSRVVTALASL